MRGLGDMVAALGVEVEWRIDAGVDVQVVFAGDANNILLLSARRHEGQNREMPP